jgi:N,N'-diacetyllegionaminate synthase
MNKVFIIAEAGVNHNGDLGLAKKLIDAACFAGADAVKFQTFNSKRLVSKFAQKAEYQKLSTDVNESQLEMLKKLELSKEGHYELLAYCRLKNIMFLSSPFDLESVDFLKDLGLDVFKIPSGEITNLPFLRKIGSLKKTVILSTGMSDLSEVEDALNILVESGTDKRNISILHCNTEYPTPFTDVNLNAMKSLADTFKTAIGYSDHTIGIAVSLAAVALGATIIEKHFTLDKEMEGPDHKASLNPTELNNLVSGIREIEQALGLSIKSPTPSESKNIKVARKSIVALKDIIKGEILSEENLTVKRPGTGISPMKWDSVIGKVASRNFEEDELIEI